MRIICASTCTIFAIANFARCNGVKSFVSKRKKSSEHQCTDSDVRDLIYMWQQEECLYNTQNKDYHNSTKRSRAIKRILKSEIIITSNYQNQK